MSTIHAEKQAAKNKQAYSHAYAQGRSFAVEVPHPAGGHGEFVLLKSRYDAAVRRCWEVGDSCQVRLGTVRYGMVRLGMGRYE